MALIIVLWLVVLLSIMAGGHARNTHIDTRLAAQQVGLAQARALADGGIQHAILELLTNSNATQRSVDGTLFSVSIGSEPVTLAIRDATGLVDLNSAGADLLAAAFLAGGADEMLQRELTDAILDWRDSDNLSHLNGAEDDDYKAARLPWTARDGAFETVDELKYVLGMPQELFNRVAPLLTVHSGSTRLDLDFAPPHLIAAVTGEAIGLTTPPRAGTAPDSSSDNSGSAGSGTYHIYASATGAADATATVEAVVRLTTGQEVPYTILEWREPSRVAVFAANEGSE